MLSRLLFGVDPVGLLLSYSLAQGSGKGQCWGEVQWTSHAPVCHHFSWREWEDRRLFPSHPVPFDQLRTEDICLLSPVKLGRNHGPGDSKLQFVFSGFHSRSDTVPWLAL